MTSFGWKRKIGDSVKKTALTKFQDVTGVVDGDDSDEELYATGEIDWVELSRIKKKSKVMQLEDNEAKSNRLKIEGETLAESERFWEAIKKWDEAIELTPSKAKLYEMKAQALMEVAEVYPAVKTAEKAVQLDPKWWVAHQTLGRALLGLGEIGLAIASFCKALHLNPTEMELWQDDLAWAVDLHKQKKWKEKEKQEAESEKENTGEVKDTVIIKPKGRVKAR
ncbi:tetratricopeptide repeat protein 33-like [Ptychodera flava]|uniref:tetratricopeptide repeat protein 33-like n=1 Tax=Ptychodera flava TaxID=63121 RepID=UPI00396A4E76